MPGRWVQLLRSGVASEAVRHSSGVSIPDERTNLRLDQWRGRLWFSTFV